MRKTAKAIIIASAALLSCFGVSHAQTINSIPPLDPFTTTSTPSASITQRSVSRPLQLTGLSSNSPVCTDFNDFLTTLGCSGGGGGGSASAALPYGGVQYSVRSGTSTILAASSSLTFSTTTGQLTVPFIYASSTATSTFVSGIVSPCFATSTGQPCIIPGSGGGASYFTNSGATTTLSTGSALQSAIGYFGQLFATSSTLTSLVSNSLQVGTSSSAGSTLIVNGDQAIQANSNSSGGASVAINQQSGTGYGLLETGGVNYLGGNLGIGTPSPSTALSVVGTSTLGGVRLTGLSSTVLSVDSGGNLVATSSASLGTNYFSNSAATTTLTTGTALAAGMGVFGAVTATSSAGIYSNGPIQVNPAGSSNSSPAIFGFSPGIGSGQAAQLQFGDNFNVMQIDYGGRLQESSYWGVEVRGNQESSAPSFVAGSVADASLSVYGTYLNSENILSLDNNAGTALDAVSGAGNLGIGTTTPSTPLYVVGTTTTSGARITGLSSTVLAVDASGNVIATTTSGGGSGTVNSGTAGQVAYYASNGTAVSGTSTLTFATSTGQLSSLTFAAASSTATSTFAGSMTLGSTSNPAAVVVAANGNVGIGSSTPGYTLTASGTVDLLGIGTLTGQNALCVSATTGQVFTSGNTTCLTSSEYTKHDIATMTQEEAQRDMDGLRAITYVSDDNGSENVGFVAEEVEKVDPRLVDHAQADETIDGHLFRKGDPVSVDYGNITAVIVKYYQDNPAPSSEPPKGGGEGDVFEWAAIALIAALAACQQIQIRRANNK